MKLRGRKMMKKKKINGKEGNIEKKGATNGALKFYSERETKKRNLIKKGNMRSRMNIQ